MTETPTVIPPSDDEIRREQNATRKSVLAAMLRMLEGRPEIAPRGRLSVASLAQEAGIPRSRLTTGSLRDLGERFAALIEAQNTPTTAKEIALSDALEKLGKEHQQLVEVHGRTLAERDQWKAAATSWARIVQVLKVENTNQQSAIESLQRRLSGLRGRPGGSDAQGFRGTGPRPTR